MTYDPDIPLDPVQDDPAFAWPDEEPFRFMRGLLVALPLSALLWAGIIYAWRVL